VITQSSSAEIIQFPTAAPSSPTRNFQAWKEAAWRRVISDPRVSHAATRIFGFILCHVNQDTGGWALCVGTIVAGLGASIGERHVRRCIAELVEYGHLRLEPRPGHANFYAPTLAREGCTPDSRVRGYDSHVRGTPDTHVNHYLLYCYL
jgi:hypothetical protein